MVVYAEVKNVQFNWCSLLQELECKTPPDRALNIAGFHGDIF